jgi:hypothetical protein
MTDLRIRGEATAFWARFSVGEVEEGNFRTYADASADRDLFGGGGYEAGVNYPSIGQQDVETARARAKAIALAADLAEELAYALVREPKVVKAFVKVARRRGMTVEVLNRTVGEADYARTVEEEEA